MSDLKQTIYLRQSSGFGPWVECEKSHPDAVAFDRRTQPDTVDGDPIGDLQAESRQAKLDDFIASMKTQPEATAPAQAAKTVPVLNDRGKFHPYDTRISTATVFTEITVPCDQETDFDRELTAFEAWFALDPTDYSLKEIIKRGWFARAALASSANALSGAIDKDAKIAAQRARIMELEEQLARALDTPVNDWCPECHARESSGDALSAGDSQKALDALLTRIDDAFEAYERYGGICEFEGNPMIYADTLTEIVTLRGEYHAILQSQKGGGHG